MFINGFYKVDNYITPNKVDALIYATKHNKRFEDIVWNFNNELFGKTDWTVEPAESIQSLYKKRAQQLRDKYPYIIARFSGGADSTNMVDSFLENGIFLDEILYMFPKQLYDQQQIKPDGTNKASSNWVSEFELTVKPKLDYYKKLSPHTKITLYDYSGDTQHYLKDEYYYQHTTASIMFARSQTNISFQDSLDYKRLADKQSKVCHLYGIDKPYIYKSQRGYNFYMSDLCFAMLERRHNKQTENMLTDNYVIEPFYFSKDCIDLLKKQCHLIVKWLKQNRQYDFLIAPDSYRKFFKPGVKPDWIEAWGDLVVPIIYPSFDTKVFQAYKQSSPFASELDNLHFNAFKNTKYFDVYVKGLENLKMVIDRSLFNREEITIAHNNRLIDVPKSLRKFNSPLYFIGK
jgi:hypothetical protein